MRQFFQIRLTDVWAGIEPAHHVLRLIEHLHIMPQSRIFALSHGDLDWMGWDTATQIAASTHNLIASLVAGLSKDADLESMLVRLPGSGKAAEVQEISFPTIAEFSEAMFTDFMYR